LDREGLRFGIVAAVILALAVPVAVHNGSGRHDGSAAFAESAGASKTDHAPVALLDEDGQRIDPKSENPKPYSPRKTCGSCHDYEAITKAYHFQLGADRVADDYGRKIGKPWVSSGGQFGRQQHMSYAWIAKKSNTSPAEIGMTSYQYSQTCGYCHTGGGPMERDRDGQRYDLRQAEHPELADSLDGDYHKAAWHNSGVAEADCLMCHLTGYDGQARNGQLSKANFRWAATAGAGLAVVDCSVKEGQAPRLEYDTSRFSGDATVAMRITRSGDANCLLCHGEAELKKRGHVWQDSRQADVHTEAGMRCIACHRAGPDHQIRKGRSSDVRLDDELDDPSFSCEGCHLATNSVNKPAHKALPESHLSTIACVTCHVTEHNVAAVGVVDTTTGKAMGLPTVKGAKKYGETGAWIPAFFRLKDGKMYSGNALLPVWWGNQAGGVIYPLHLAETARAYERVKDVIRDDDGDGRPEANTETEIRAMLTSVRQVLKGGRFRNVAPVYVKGNRVWELGGGRLVARSHPQARPLYWTFSHNVSRTENALGAKGCSDCHGVGSTFFDSPVIVDPFDRESRQVTVPMWQYCGISANARNAVR